MNLIIEEPKERILETGDIVSIKDKGVTINYITCKVSGIYFLVNFNGNLTRFYLDRFGDINDLELAIKRIKGSTVKIYKSTDYSLKMIKKGD